MSMIKKVVTLLRSSVREIGESVVDANATRVYEQEILDAKQAIAQARQELTGVMAQEKQSAREVLRLEGEIEHFENLAVEALQKSQQSLAEEVALQVAHLEQELESQRQSHANFTSQVSRLKNLIKGAEVKIRDHEREIAIAKTTESVYRATRSISDNIDSSGSSLANARESLERIRQRHQNLADRMEAAEVLENELKQGHDGKALEAKLAAAGIGAQPERAAHAMARIQEKLARQKSMVAAEKTGEVPRGDAQ